MEAIMQRVNVLFSLLLKGGEPDSLANVFGGDTNDKTFNFHLIKALKVNEGERVRTKTKYVCMCWISARTLNLEVIWWG